VADVGDRPPLPARQDLLAQDALDDVAAALLGKFSVTAPNRLPAAACAVARSRASTTRGSIPALKCLFQRRAFSRPPARVTGP